MIRLRVAELLKESGHTKYWLCKQLDTSWQNLSKMLNNETNSIRYEIIETLCQIFECTPNDLFAFDEEPYEGFSAETKKENLKSRNGRKNNEGRTTDAP